MRNGNPRGSTTHAILMIAAAVALTVVAPARADTVKISIPAEIADFAPYWIADQRGYFKSEGLDVEFLIVGGQTATPALISGSINYSGSTSSAMTAALKGAALKTILVGQSRTHHQLWSFDPDVKTITDLKGKLVTITSRGGADDIATRMYLKARGLPTDYLGVTPLATGPARTAAVTNGAIKYITLGRPERHELLPTGMLQRGTLVADLTKDVELQTGGLSTTVDELEKNRDRAKKVLRAVWKGTMFWMTQREATIAEIQKRYRQMTAEAILRDLDGAREDLDEDGIVSPEAATRELTVRAELLDLKPEAVPPREKFFDFSIIEEVRNELKAQNWQATP